MSENLPANSSGNLPVPGKAAEITVSGGNNSFVAHADTVENNITVMLNFQHGFLSSVCDLG